MKKNTQSTQHSWKNLFRVHKGRLYRSTPFRLHWMKITTVKHLQSVITGRIMEKISTYLFLLWWLPRNSFSSLLSTPEHQRCHPSPETAYVHTKLSTRRCYRTTGIPFQFPIHFSSFWLSLAVVWIFLASLSDRLETQKDNGVMATLWHFRNTMIIRQTILTLCDTPTTNFQQRKCYLAGR